jgi:hypothetical protein
LRNAPPLTYAHLGKEAIMATIETDLQLRIWGVGNAERVVLLHGANVPDPEQTW